MSDIGILDLLPKNLLKHFIFKYLNQYDRSLMRCVCSFFKILIGTVPLEYYKNELTIYAAENGYLGLLIWLLEEKDHQWYENFSNYPARMGRLEILEYIYKNGYSYSECLAADAAEGGHVKVLDWMKIEKIPFCMKYRARAARSGKLEVLKWSINNHDSVNLSTTNLHKDFFESLCEDAALGGHLDILVWLKSQKFYWEDWIIPWSAAKNGHVHILIWAKENGCEFKKAICDMAVESGEFEALKWLYMEGYTIDSETTCTKAAFECSMEMMIWLINKGGKYDRETFEEAVMGAIRKKNYDLVEYLWKNKCPIVNHICDLAAQYDSVEMIELLMEKGFNCGSFTLQIAAKSACMNVLKWWSVRCPQDMEPLLQYIHKNNHKSDPYDKRMISWLTRFC